jgi:hypothetical protein
MGNNPIAVFVNGELHLNVQVDEAHDTVWLNEKEMAQLFGVNRTSILRHISNIYRAKSSIKSQLVQNLHKLKTVCHPITKTSTYFNLDVILAVGYRIHSPKGVAFRHWASSVLKDYLLKGYALNQSRLAQLEKQVKIFEIAARAESLSTESKSEFFDLLTDFEKGLILLDDFDHQSFPKQTGGQKATYQLTYEDARALIDALPFSQSSTLFGKERAEGLFKGSIASIYQTFDSQEVYPTLESKAAHLLYFLVKDHGFLDGNKRIAATLFIYYLKKNGALAPEGPKTISPTTLAATTLLIAESHPEEMELILSFILGVIG